MNTLDTKVWLKIWTCCYIINMNVVPRKHFFEIVGNSEASVFYKIAKKCLRQLLVMNKKIYGRSRNNSASKIHIICFKRWFVILAYLLVKYVNFVGIFKSFSLLKVFYINCSTWFKRYRYEHAKYITMHVVKLRYVF